MTATRGTPSGESGTTALTRDVFDDLMAGIFVAEHDVFALRWDESSANIDAAYIRRDDRVNELWSHIARLTALVEDGRADRIPPLTGCCVECGTKPRIEIGPVNDTTCIRVDGNCGCDEGFNLWPIDAADPQGDSQR